MSDDQTERLGRSLREGLHVSQASLGWTVVAGGAAVVIGLSGSSLALVAFGLTGLLDGVGSGSLIVHFRHSLRHETVSEQHERMALVIVTAGMAAIGLATLADSVYRLLTHGTAQPLPAGVALAGASAAVLAVLAARKRQVSRRIPSHALLADGWLSGVGTVLGLVTVAGTGIDAGLGWWWTDSASAIAVAIGALSLSVVLTRRPNARS